MSHHQEISGSDTGSDSHREAARTALIAGLRNAHALERQAVSVIETQLKALDDYPELHARLAQHAEESRQQGHRIDSLLREFGGSTSMIKDTLMSMMGMGQSSVQGMAEDAVIKATLADTMFEHLEIASYRALFVMADLAGAPQVRERLQQSLDEEIAMAKWLEDNLESVTRRYVELSAASSQDKTMVRDTETGSATTTPGHDEGGSGTASQARDEHAELTGGDDDRPWYARPTAGSAVAQQGSASADATASRMGDASSQDTGSADETASRIGENAGQGSGSDDRPIGSSIGMTPDRTS
jgi:ferritin-like metal-binding protein YciE